MRERPKERKRGEREKGRKRKGEKEEGRESRAEYGIHLFRGILLVCGNKKNGAFYGGRLLFEEQNHFLFEE